MFNLEILPPIAIHSKTRREVIAEINAALPLAHGINIPRVNRPRTGPPNIPNIPSHALLLNV